VRRGPAALLALALGFAGVLAIAGPASAHNQIVSSTPAPNQTLTELPARFEIDTNEKLLDIGGTGRGFAFEILDAAGTYYETGCVSIVDDAMFTTARLGSAGTYTIIYQLVSADGHSVSGRIPFTWAPTGDAAITQGVASPPGCHGAAGPATPKPGNGGSEAGRDSTVPLADILWIGGILVAVALAVVITLVITTRRQPGDEPSETGDGPTSR
jgi:methionine-rich copper-binding protein CopC